MVTSVTRPPAPLPRLEHAVFGLAVVGFLLGAPGGPGWGAASANAVLGAHLDRAAAAPLYGALADVAAWLPVGEPGFRLAALDALLAALLLAGVVAATRALVPKLPGAGAVGALLLALAPPLHEASGPGLLAAGGAVWALAGALRASRRDGDAGRGDARDAVGALGGCAVAIGAEPWFGTALLLATVAWLVRAGARRDVLALAVAGIGAATIALWLGALGDLPGLAPNLGATLAASGQGAGAIVVGAGLLGAAFAAVTGLPGARGLLGAIAIAGAHAALVAGEPRGTPELGLLAIGAALLPVAIVRAAAPATTGLRALGVTLGAGLPLVLVALVAGPWELPGATRTGDAPARVAREMIDLLPPGPGVVIASRDASWFAIGYAQALAGARPDLALAPPLPPERADAVVVAALRADEIAGGDVPAIGRLDITFARPRGRGYQLLLDTPAAAPELAPGPAAYGAGAGEREAQAEAIERARYEASSGRLDQAARAAGLAGRFGAADLAVLAATRPSPARPALFGFVPALGMAHGAWQLELLGDDLAWVAGIEQTELAETIGTAPPRRLHALWRALLAKKIPADDPRIRGFGDEAVRATAAMLAELGPREDKKNRR